MAGGVKPAGCALPVGRPPVLKKIARRLRIKCIENFFRSIIFRNLKLIDAFDSTPSISIGHLTYISLYKEGDYDEQSNHKAFYYNSFSYFSVQFTGFGWRQG
jgi:hypothetical protein